MFSFNIMNQGVNQDSMELIKGLPAKICLFYIYFNISISAVRSTNPQQQTHRHQQSNNIRTVCGSFRSKRKSKHLLVDVCSGFWGQHLQFDKKHEQEAHHASNNYATAYYTKSPSLLDIILHVIVRLVQCQLHGSESSSTEGAKNCLTTASLLQPQ